MSSAASRSTAHGSSRASNFSHEGSSSASCAVKGWISSKDTTFVQVERKLRRLEAYKNLEGDELLKKVNDLIQVENILLNFSHLVEDKLVKELENVVDDKEDQVDPDNVQEVREAKDREKSRHVQIANIPLKIGIWDLDIPEPVMPLLCPIGNFLCTDYGTKHVGLTVGDVFLEWGRESLVIPTKVEDGKEAFPGGEVLDITKDCPHNIAADQKAPHDSLQLKTTAEETDHLFQRTLDKKPIFEELAKVISKYNTKFHYHAVSRNCQGFVRDALKALGVDNKPATPQPNPQLQELQSKKSKGMPSGFAKHEDLDAYMMKQKQDWLEKLDADSFEFLQLSYLHFHGDIACHRPTCQAHLLAGVFERHLNL